MAVANVQILLKRGNAEVSSTYTGPVGEITIDTTSDTLRIHDGIVAGGFLLPNATAFQSNITDSNVAMRGYVDYTVQSNIEALTEQIVGAAPEILDTLEELANVLQGNANVISGIIETVSQANVGMKGYVDEEVLQSNVGLKGYTDNAIISLSASDNVLANGIVTANTIMAGYVDEEVLQSNVGLKGYVDEEITQSNVGLKGYVDETVTQSDNGSNVAMKGYVDNAVNVSNIGQTGYTDNKVETANIGMIGFVGSSVTTANIGQTGYTDNAIDTANVAQTGYTDNAVNQANVAQTGYTNEQVLQANVAMKGYVDEEIATADTTANVGIIGYVDDAVLTANIGQIGYTDEKVQQANVGLKGYTDFTIVQYTDNAVDTANIGMRGYVNNLNNQSNVGMKGYVDSVATLSSYGNANVEAYLAAFEGNIQTVTNANVAMKGYVDETVTQANVGQAGYIDSEITGANLSMKGYVDNEVVTLNSAVTNANIGMTAYVDAEIIESNIGQIGYTDDAIASANSSMRSYVDNEVVTLNSAVTDANVGMKGYVDETVTQANLAMIGYVDTEVAQVNSAIDVANVAQIGYIDNAVTTANTGVVGLVNSLNLDDLNNVSTNVPVTGNVLKWDGTQWAPATDTTSGGGGTDADTLDGFDSAYYLDYNNFANTPPTYSNVNTLSYLTDNSYATEAFVTAGNVGMKGYVDNEVSTTALGQVTQANVGMKGYVDNEVVTLNSAVTNANIGQIGYTDNAVNQANVAQIGYIDNAVTTANVGVVGYVDQEISNVSTNAQDQAFQANIGQTGYTNEAIATANVGQIGYTDNAINVSNIGQIGYTDNAVNVSNIGQIGYTDYTITQANVGMKGYVDDGITAVLDGASAFKFFGQTDVTGPAPSSPVEGQTMSNSVEGTPDPSWGLDTSVELPVNGVVVYGLLGPSDEWAVITAPHDDQGLDDLTNVSNNAPATGNVLKWDGTQWAPATDATSGNVGLNADTLDGFDGSYYLDYGNFANVPVLANVALTGSYNSLSDTPGEDTTKVSKTQDNTITNGINTYQGYSGTNRFHTLRAVAPLTGPGGSIDNSSAWGIKIDIDNQNSGKNSFKVTTRLGDIFRINGGTGPTLNTGYAFKTTRSSFTENNEFVPKSYVDTQVSSVDATSLGLATVATSGSYNDLTDAPATTLTLHSAGNSMYWSATTGALSTSQWGTGTSNPSVNGTFYFNRLYTNTGAAASASSYTTTADSVLEVWKNGELIVKTPIYDWRTSDRNSGQRMCEAGGFRVTTTTGATFTSSINYGIILTNMKLV